MEHTFKIGLAPKKVSFFDDKTKLYLTLEQPFKELMVSENADLSGLARGLFTLNPAIVLLEGTFPEEEKEKFKKRYEIPFQVFKRADNIVESAPGYVAPTAPVEPEVVAQSFSEATLFDVNDPADEVDGKDEAPQEDAVPKKTSTRKTSTKKTEA